MSRAATIDPTVGQRIRARRTLANLTQRDVAVMVGISHTTLGRIEKGVVAGDNRFTLAGIAQALRCSVAELTGEHATPGTRDAVGLAQALHDTMAAAIDADLDLPPEPDPGQDKTIEQLTAELDLVRSLRLKAEYRGAAQRLPDLIGDLHRAAAHGPDRAQALRMLVITHEAASNVVRYGGNATASHYPADRAQQAAEALADPVMLGLAAWARAHAAAATGLYQRAFRLADTAAAALRPHLDDQQAAVMTGQLTLTAAFSLCALGRIGEIAERLQLVDDLAARTGDVPDLDMCFGPTNTLLWKLAMQVDAGDPAAAVALADTLNPDRIVQKIRKSSYFVDFGRALTRVGDDNRAVTMLAAAERVAPQRVHSSPEVAETARALLERSRRRSTTSLLRGLCERMGVPT